LQLESQSHNIVHAHMHIVYKLRDPYGILTGSGTMLFAHHGSGNPHVPPGHVSLQDLADGMKPLLP